MKIALYSCLLSSATAFIGRPLGRPVTTGLQAASPAAIQAALEASKQYGAASPEARVAWDAVEEMDAADNSIAVGGSLDNECEVEGPPSEECLDYADKLQELQDILAATAPKVSALKNLAADIQAIKMTQVPSKPAPDSPQVRAALEAAKKASADFGADSPEARVAWAELEEIASSGLSNAMGTRLDEECLVESAEEACRALEELNRAVNLAKTREAGVGDY